MNRNTFDELSNTNVTMRYIEMLSGFPIIIKDGCVNGEIRIME